MPLEDVSDTLERKSVKGFQLARVGCTKNTVGGMTVKTGHIP